MGGAVFCRSELTAPWGVDFDRETTSAGFHILVRGTCWLHLAGQAPRQLVQGDVVLMAHGSPHGLSDDPMTPRLDYGDVQAAAGGRCGTTLRGGGGGTETVILCGAYHFDYEGVHPLLSLLPPVIHIPADEGRVAGPLEAALRLVSAEYAKPGPGTTAVVNRLVDVLFVYIVRGWLENQPDGTAGWLGALRDPEIGQSLTLIHGQPEREWTLDSLADAVTLSRAVFARRFRELVGEPPATYLTRWRMDLAARLLREGPTPMVQVAQRVGYTSEYAFNKAFSRIKGVSPGRYRKAGSGIRGSAVAERPA